MDDGLKQRLIGALALLAIAVIFIPVLFDRQTLTPVSTVTEVPPMPVIEIEPVIVAQAPEVVSPAPIPEEMLVPDDTKPESVEPTPPKLNENGVPHGWVLQVVSYEEKPKAEEFRDRLIADGYRAYLREAKISKGVFYRVYIGPKLDKNGLLKDKAVIDKKYSLNSIILDITPKQ
jgi:DedD protein